MGLFSPITLSDKPMLDEYLNTVERNEGSECTFSNMFIWAEGDRIEWCVRNDSLFLHTFSQTGEPCMMMTFTKKEKFCEAIEDALSLCEELGETLHMSSLPEWYVERMKECCPDMFVFEREPHHDDYVYEAHSLIELHGKDLHAKRNHINKFMSMFTGRYEYERYARSMYDECMTAYDTWLYERGDTPELCAERDSVIRALKFSEELGLIGGVIRVDGKIEAFTIGEVITPDMALIHIEKANVNVPGLFSVINQMFVEKEFSHLKWINREEDMGIEGLRRAKRSYKPARMVEKYGARLAPA